MSKWMNPVTEYMFKYYWTDEYLGLCTLCGNTGIINTTETAISPRGYRVGKKQYCLCPNGQSMRENNKAI